MKVADTAAEGPARITPIAPRIYTNTPENILRSLERLARWTLRKNVSKRQIAQVRACVAVLKLRVDMERLEMDRDRYARDERIERMLEAVEDRLIEDKGK
ncbi:MAG: hypothetical protein QF879_13575 [Candidatus Latescibacteria bacterium]|jgi:hypothetical protein|nr:hypothetical protein [Candidatus Latescibacterota bacterium]